MVTNEDARRFLGDVQGDRCFWVNNGHVVKNLAELAHELKEMPENIFRYHHNKEKKDFANWVREIIGDGELAEDLLKCKSKDAASKKVLARLSELHRKAK
jgi:hypothetical protein